jgi:hypothetical protein
MGKQKLFMSMKTKKIVEHLVKKPDIILFILKQKEKISNSKFWVNSMSPLLEHLHNISIDFSILKHRQ